MGFRGRGAKQAPGDFQVPKYSRSAGVTAYRRRRRRSRVFRAIVAVILITIIGSAALLFGRAYFDYEKLPFDIPELPSRTEGTYSAESQTEVKPATMRVASAGDIIMNSSVVDSGRLESGAYSFNHLFAHLTHELVTFDLRTLSQETAMAGSAYGFGYTWPLNAPQELGRAEVASGFNVILHATDHTLDTGYEGVHNELSWWHAELPNTPILGIAEPDPVANPGLSDYVNNVFTVEKDGFRIAILNHSVGIVDNDRHVVSALDEEKVRQDVLKAKDLGAEMIIACPHWGQENIGEVTEEQERFAHLYADLGVDVIVGTHPRVLQRAEIIQGANGHRCVCFYSLGCLTSSLNHENFLGGLAEFTLSRAEGGSCAVTGAVIKPIVTYRAGGDAYTTYLLSDYNDDLAWAGWDGITRDTFQTRCREILGEGYNADTCELVLIAEPEPEPEPAPEPAEGQAEPAAEEAPAEGAPAEEAPAEEAPAEAASTEEAAPEEAQE